MQHPWGMNTADYMEKVDLGCTKLVVPQGGKGNSGASCFYPEGGNIY